MALSRSVGDGRLAAAREFWVARIDVDETLGRLHRGEAIAFVDARREEQWRRATDKLPGALRLAPNVPDETLPVIPAGRAAVAYCACPAQASSVAAAELLRARGYENVYVLEGGLEAWRLARGPTEPIEP